jgi:glycosyltransferase involved in cell wall biosynthesis
LRTILKHQGRELYWATPALQHAYSSLASTQARLAVARKDLYAALCFYSDAARRTRSAELRAERMKAFAGFVQAAWEGKPPTTLNTNPFVRAFLLSADAEKDRTRLRSWTAEKRRTMANNVIVLKAPQQDEKGVLLIKYTPYFLTFLVNYRIPEITDRYSLVLEPSWYLYPSPYWALFACTDDSVVLECFSDEIKDAIVATGIPLVPVPVGSQDWVDTDVFRPLAGTNKDFDVVMIASFQRLKRHDVLFRAMQKIRPRRLKVALIGATWERDRREFEEEIRKYAVQDDCTIFQGLKPEQVNEVLNRSKVKVLLSKIEGGNKSVMEALAAGTPCVVYKHLIGRRDVHPETGLYVEDDELADALLYMSANYGKFSTREWLMRNSGIRNTTARLNAELQRKAAQTGNVWTADIVPKVNKYAGLRYHNDEDESRLRAATLDLETFLVALS